MYQQPAAETPYAFVERSRVEKTGAADGEPSVGRDEGTLYVQPDAPTPVTSLQWARGVTGESVGAKAASIPPTPERARRGEKEAELRLRILTRQRFERELTPEERARLVILDERLRLLVPAVSAPDLEALENVRAVIDGSRALLENIRSRRAARR